MTNSTETEIVLLQNGVKVSAYLKITAVYRESVSDDTDPDETLLELAHGNSMYIGRGKDYLYTDALADLQTKLPRMFYLLLHDLPIRNYVSFRKYARYAVLRQRAFRPK